MPKEYKTAFLSTFIIGLFTHAYAFTNTLLCGDSVYNFYATQDMTVSGRWALSLACGLSSYYDLPWINGLMSLLFISLTVVIITKIFQLKNPVLIAIVGGILVTSIPTTATLFYRFTADGYMLAMLLATLAVCYSKIGEKRVWAYALSVACICIACGIYQAYVAFALVLALCYFIYELLKGSHTLKDYFLWIRNQIIIYLAGLASYYGIWKICLWITGKSATDYQGISEVGTINLSILKNGLKQSILTPIKHFFPLDGFEYGISLFSVLNVLLFVLLVVALIAAIVKTKMYRSKMRMVLLAISLCAVFPFACMWHFASEEVFYYSLMLQSLYLLFVLVALLSERFGPAIFKNIVAVFLCVVVFHNAILANIGYYYMEACYERSYAEGVQMVMQIRTLQEDYEITKVAVIGDRVETLTKSNIDEQTGMLSRHGRTYAISERIRVSLLEDSTHTKLFLQNVLGLELEWASEELSREFAQLESVKSMGCWPDTDSVAVIGDTVVIKFSDISV